MESPEIKNKEDYDELDDSEKVNNKLFGKLLLLSILLIISCFIIVKLNV